MDLHLHVDCDSQGQPTVPTKQDLVEMEKRIIEAIKSSASEEQVQKLTALASKLSALAPSGTFPPNATP